MVCEFPQCLGHGFGFQEGRDRRMGDRLYPKTDYASQSYCEDADAKKTKNQESMNDLKKQAEILQMSVCYYDFA